jgi:hypothetical protein
MKSREPKKHPVVKFTKYGKILITIMALATGAVAVATPVTVLDPSFEQLIFTNGAGRSYNVTPGGSFSLAGDNNSLLPAVPWWATGYTENNSYPSIYLQNASASLFPVTTSNTLAAPADGSNYIVLGGSGDENLWQDVGPLQSNTVYTLTVAVALDLQNGFSEPANNGGYGGGTALMALVKGTEIMDIFQPGAIMASQPIENTNYNLGTWIDNTLVFTNGSQASGDLTILFRGTGGFAVDLDNVRLDATPVSGFTAVVPSVTTDRGPNTTTNPTTVYQGALVTLAENAAGVAPFTYGWVTDNGSAGTTWTAIHGANGSNYVVNTTGINTNTPVEYAVVVTNGSSVSTSPPVVIGTITGPPVLLRDTLPSTYSFDVVGSTLAFNAVFDGSRPLTYQWQFNGTNLPGATNDVLTLQLTSTNQTGDYSLVASNDLGTNASTPQLFTVYPVPPATNGIIITGAMEGGTYYDALGYGYNQPFDATWALNTNNILAGLLPTSSIGIFSNSGDGGLPVLTDGSIAGIDPTDNGSYGCADAGNGSTATGEGYSITYTLPPTESGDGWTITNITSYGGSIGYGRNEQTYQVLYSSPLAPTNFTRSVPWTAFNPPNIPDTVPIFGPASGDGVPLAVKMSVIPASGVLAQNVAAVTFYFNSSSPGQSPKNGFEEYSELQLFGYPSTNLPPALIQPITPQSGSDVVGSQVTIEAAFTAQEPFTYQWLKDGTPIPNQTNATLTLTNLQLSDTSTNPGYVLEAISSTGVGLSSPCSFEVYPAPTADGYGVIFSEANQAVAVSEAFMPTWTVATNSLIAGLFPFTYTGNVTDGAYNSPAILTDGQFGTVGLSDADVETMGGPDGAVAAGQYLYYALPPSSNGWDITSIESYGGWADTGHNQQEYAIYYATAADPNYFIELDQMPLYSPPVASSGPNATRVTWTASPGAPLASNVVAVEFDFSVSPYVVGGYGGYTELQVFGTNSQFAAAPVQQAPFVVTDIAPGYGSDVVGSQIIFTAAFGGSPPMSYQWQFDGTNMPGQTGSTLTIDNLTTNDTGSYDLVATNAYGSNITSVAQFTVNPAPAPVNGVYISAASQFASSGSLGLTPFAFTPTWPIAGGSLIQGQQPSNIGSGNFIAQWGCVGVSVLTDGQVGLLVNGGDTSPYVTCGGGGAGTSVTYTLNGSATGYTINSIATYGGWDQWGRDWPFYTIDYSTVSNPTSFQTLGQAGFQLPNLAPGDDEPCAWRVVWQSTTGGPLASNVAAVKFDFTQPPGAQNGWGGYSELQLFGAPTSVVTSTGPTITSSVVSNGYLVVAGTGGAPGASYAWLTAANLQTPLSAWSTISTGTFDGSGNFSGSIPINHSEPQRYFRLSTP